MPFAAHDASADQTPSSFQNIFAATLRPEISAPAPRPATPERPSPERPTPPTARMPRAEGSQRPAASAADAAASKARGEAKPSSPADKSRAASQSVTKQNGADQGTAPHSGVNPTEAKQNVGDPAQAQAQPQTLPLPANPPLPLAVAATAAPSQPDRPAGSVGNPNPSAAIVSLPPGGAIPPLASSGGSLGSTDIAFALHITPDDGANQSGPPAGPPQTAVSPNAKPADTVPSPPAAASAPLTAKQTVSSAAAPNTAPASAVSAAVGSAGTPPRPRSAAFPAASPGGSNPDGKPDGNPVARPIVNPVINAFFHANPASNPTPWAAPTLDTANSGTSRMESTVAAAPVSAIAADSSDAAALAMRSVRVQLAGEGDQRVDMRLVEYAGGLSVSVRASDNSLTRGLQDHLPELSARLAAEHYQSQAWLPSVSEAPAGKSSAASSEQSAEQQAGRGGGQTFSQGGSSSSSGGDRQQRQQQGRNPERPGAWWAGPSAARPAFASAAAEWQSSSASPLGIPTANSNQEK